MGADLMQDVRTAAAQRTRRESGEVVTEAMRREITASVSGSELFSKMSDHFRQISARCFDETRHDAQVLAVSSATKSTGTSSVVLGLAAATARNLGADVLIIETDMRRPQLARDLGVQTAIGLSDYLSRDLDLGTIISPTPSARVWLLPAGRTASNPGPLVRSEKFAQLLKNLRALQNDHGKPAFRSIIIDAPPILTSSDSKVVADQTDGLLLVVRAGETHAHDVTGALRIAGSTPVKGIVLNRARTWLPAWLSRMFGLSQFDFE